MPLMKIPDSHLPEEEGISERFGEELMDKRGGRPRPPLQLREDEHTLPQEPAEYGDDESPQKAQYEPPKVMPSLTDPPPDTPADAYVKEPEPPDSEEPSSVQYAQVSGQAIETDWMPRIQQKARELFPDDQEMQDRFMLRAQTKMRSSIAIQLSQRRQQILHEKGEIDRTMYTALKSTGVWPRTMEEALQVDPHFEERVDNAANLNPAIKKHVRDTLLNNAKQDVPKTKERWEAWQAARGEIARAKAGLANRDDVLKMSVGGLDLPREWAGDLNTKLSELNKQKNTDVSMALALSNIRRQVDDVPGLRGNEHKYNQFVAGFQAEMEDWEKREGKKPKRDDQQKIAADLLREHAVGGLSGFFGGTEGRYEIPDDFMTDEKRERYKRTFGDYPTPSDIYRLWQLKKVQ